MKKILVLVTVLALVAAMVVPMTVGATPDPGPVGSTTIGASIAATIEVDAPTTGSMGNMLVNKTATNGSLVALKVFCNKVGWDLTATANNSGYMTSVATPADALAGAFNINGPEVSAYTPLTSSVDLVHSDGTLTETTGDSITIGGQQAVTYQDVAHDDYSITITFTGTP
jgi:uncharacterized protein YdbL (DUF1318 family)